MSLSAKRFQGKVFNQSLEEALFEEGYKYAAGKLEDIYNLQQGYKAWDLSQEEVEIILSLRETKSFEEILSDMPEKSRGATWIAKQVYWRHWQQQFDIKTLCNEWSAVKELRSWEACNQELCKKLDVSYGKLMHIGIRFAWQADRFCALYEQVYVANRPWGSCYQANHGKVKAIALTPNYNRLPLWVKKAMALAHEWVQTERVGNIWSLKSCAKAWKHCPALPKSLAKKVGRLSVKARILSRLAWEIAVNNFSFSSFYVANKSSWTWNEEFFSRSEITKNFWQHLKRLLSASYLEVLEIFAYCQYKYEADRFSELYLSLPHKSFTTRDKFWSDHDFVESYMQRANLISSPEYQKYLREKEERERQKKKKKERKAQKFELCSKCKFYAWEPALPCAVNPMFQDPEAEHCFDWEPKSGEAWL